MIERCLAPRRADRYATALDLARAVAALVPGDPLRTGATSVEPELPTEARVVRLGRRMTRRRRGHREPLPVEGSVAEPDVDGRRGRGAGTPLRPWAPQQPGRRSPVPGAGSSW